VLLVDATNVLARAHNDLRSGHRLPGESAAGSFADWLRFLRAVSQPQLMVAVFDVPQSKRTKQQQQREQLAPEYLQRRKRRLQQAAPTPAAAARAGSGGHNGAGPLQPGGDPLRPFKRQVEQQGGVCLDAAAGWEADDGLAAACLAVQQHCPAASVLVASGDGDMQQLLTPQVSAEQRQWREVGGPPWHATMAKCVRLVRALSYALLRTLRRAALWCDAQVSWLRLHNQPTLACPLAADLVSAAAFQQQHGFPPTAYADWLAFCGGSCLLAG
jgi:hypothetical protein